MVVPAKSLANLRRGITKTKPRYEEPKKRRHLTITDKGWISAKTIMKERFGLSVSEFVERIGRGEFEVVRKEKD